VQALVSEGLLSKEEGERLADMVGPTAVMTGTSLKYSKSSNLGSSPTILLCAGYGVQCPFLHVSRPGACVLYRVQGVVLCPGG
jgi:hypothetical protein